MNSSATSTIIEECFHCVQFTSRYSIERGSSVRNEPELKHYELKLALFEPELKLSFKKNNGPGLN